MAQLYFYYSSMNAGKSTHLLQSSYNYQERDLNTAIYTAKIDDRFAQGKVASRLGIDADAFLFDNYSNLYDEIEQKKNASKIDCVLIDEAQFLSTEQVRQLTDIVDLLHIPVLAYGIRTDFLGQPFQAAQHYSLGLIN